MPTRQTCSGQRAAAEADVAARVDRVVRGAGRVEDRGRAVDRPALDEPGRVELPRAPARDVEVAAGLVAQLLAAREHAADVGVRVLERELAAVDAADLAVGLERAERRVDDPQPVEDGVDRARRRRARRGRRR